MDSVKIRKALNHAINLGAAAACVLILWKMLICVTGYELPRPVVVLSGSMEPGMRRGDVLFLHNNRDPIRAGEIVVFKTKGRDYQIVHRVIQVHKRRDTEEVDILTKGDNNGVDDINLYALGQQWLQRQHIKGRAFGFVPYVGWTYILMSGNPLIKYILIGVFGYLTYED